MAMSRDSALELSSGRRLPSLCYVTSVPTTSVETHLPWQREWLVFGRQIIDGLRRSFPTQKFSQASPQPDGDRVKLTIRCSDPEQIRPHLEQNNAQLPYGPYNIQLDWVGPVAEPQRQPYQSQQREEEQHQDQHHQPSLRQSHGSPDQSSPAAHRGPHLSQVHGKSSPQAASQTPHQQHPLPSRILARSLPASQDALRTFGHDALLLKIANEVNLIKLQHIEHVEGLRTL
ncbi:hypothetical protein P152DRAFT_453352 [Eremomyces bilateralis CBS 781.70]|uniref:Uncharacterized protein n=1 Tax=Eremomyces bilateralis CBS 781.70 TaxID=1392243 RepID=A0A6G1FQ21_9PEZI|nr:uncharacterized protein P152DRAFT_453352 [Eremomyces bilateralis CBS 781.70]KAF1807863.1 hypothetical protein P152DRAFT_453352 [Eremomyces bilateralis CBS 781.70]